MNATVSQIAPSLNAAIGVPDANAPVGLYSKQRAPPPLDSAVLAIVPFLGLICAFRILREKTSDTSRLENEN